MPDLTPDEYDIGTKYTETCSNCGYAETFTGETIEDCWWMVDYAGWNEHPDKPNKYLCPKCSPIFGLHSEREIK